MICIDAVAAAMYTIGFAETVRDLLKVNQLRIILSLINIIQEHGVKIFGTVIDGESVNIVRIIGMYKQN